MGNDTTKICTKCKKELPLEAFYRRGDNPSRYRSHCKICTGFKGARLPQTVSIENGIGLVMAGGHMAIIDLCDADLGEYRWKPNYQESSDNVYANRVNYYGDGRSVGIHRIIMARVLGRELLDTEEVDHIDNNSLNNRRDNLRLATRAQNARNRKMSKHSTAPYKGITRYGKNRWRARIETNGNRISLGVFDTPEEAHAAYCKAALMLHGQFANFGLSQPLTVDQDKLAA